MRGNWERNPAILAADMSWTEIIYHDQAGFSNQPTTTS